MKLLVFAHVPPPHHGQSYMVRLMLNGFGGDMRCKKEGLGASPHGVACYHVNCRYSEDLEDIGSVRIEKFWLVLRYCLEAIWCRFRHGVRTFYYVPAPGKRAALYRDWVVMLLCRPFFRDFIYHWHAVGLGDWLKGEGSWLERRLTHALLGRVALGLALAIPGMRDALWFRARRIALVPNGVPDPCPDYESVVHEQRRARAEARRRLLAGETVTEAGARIFRVLYLAHCTREKGLFDTLEGVALLNERLRTVHSPLRCHLTVAGHFLRREEEAEYRTRVAQPDLADCVTHAGFVEGAAKATLLRDSDCLCFPTYYAAEGQPVNLIEAMSCGLGVVTTRWRAIPDLLPAEHAGFVAARAPGEIASVLQRQFTTDDAATLRAHFLGSYTDSHHLGVLGNAIAALNTPTGQQPIPGKE